MCSLVFLLLVLRSAWSASSHPTFVAVIDGTPILAKSDTARCFSCMSKLYEGVWPMLRHVYKQPKNFTDECDDSTVANGRVQTVHCSTICVSLFEQINIAGIKIAGHIRGCMNDILVNGFNTSIVHRFRWMHRDSCRAYRKRELFKLGGDNYDDSTIDVCTCYADYCNGNTGSQITVSFLLMWLMLIFL